MGETVSWFRTWFSSPYYHILYHHRDHEEARYFLDKLEARLEFQLSDKILDLACGKGRHAIYLNKKGYDVIGLDLSEENWRAARKFENERLSFHQHDMREVFRPNYFDIILNMFTSFGYFDTEEENLNVLISAAIGLRPGGRMIIDFLNPYTVINDLVKEEEKTIKNIHFRINRELTIDGYIRKLIRIEADGQHHEYEERVKAIRRMEFLEYFRKSGLQLMDTLGDYSLNPYIPDVSRRMIFILSKPE